MKLRLLSLVLALVMLLSVSVVMIGCNDEQPNPNKDPSNDNNQPGDGPYAEYNIPDSLPERNFASEGLDEFVIATQDANMMQFFWVEDYDGGTVDNAVYRSVSAIEERFGTTVSAYQASNDQAIKLGMTTQDGSFDFAFMLDVTAAGFSLENLFTNLYDLEALDFSKPWWPDPSVEALTYQNKMYLGSSTMSYLGLGQTFLTYFNKTIFTDNGLTFPYEDVMAGDWYLEDLIELAEGYGNYDENNDIKDAEDTFGFLAPNGFYGWFESFGIELIKKESDDLILNASCEEAYDLIEDVHYIIIESDGGYTDTEQVVNDMFANNQSMFVYGKLRNAYDVFRYSQVDYGILPVPKLNEDQENYNSAYTDRFFVIPASSVSGKDAQDIGFLLEALSAQGYRTIYPAYYEEAMQNRYSTDAESKQILSMLHKYRVISFSYIYGGKECYSRALNTLIAERQSKDYASFLAEGADKAEQKLVTLRELFSGLN
jgi:hypothetical protein